MNNDVDPAQPSAKVPLIYCSRRRINRTVEAIGVASGVLLTLSIVIQLIMHDGQGWPRLILPTFCLAMWVLLRIRGLRRVVVDSQGIHCGRLFDEPWSAIESVVKPTGAFDTATRVRLAASGKEKAIAIPSSYAEQLAQIGNKPLM